MEPQDMMAAVTDSMAERTGRTLDDWVDAVQASGVDPLDQKAVRRWLKDVHGVPQNSQWAIAFAAAEAAGWTRPSTQGYADQLYSGAKAHCGPSTTRSSSWPSPRATTPRLRAAGPTSRSSARASSPRSRPVRAGRCGSGCATAARCPTTTRVEPAKGFAQATHWVQLPGDTEPDAVEWLEPLLAEAYRQNG